MSSLSMNESTTDENQIKRTGSAKGGEVVVTFPIQSEDTRIGSHFGGCDDDDKIGKSSSE
jgi:hypothetical protein